MLRKCELCSCSKKTCIQQPSGYWLCPSCQEKVAKRQQDGVSVITLDRNELWELKVDGILPVRSYVLLALRLDYPDGLNKIDVGEFCGRWRIQGYEFLAAMASLGKKGLIDLKTQEVEIQTFTRAQRMQLLEKAVKS